MRDRVHVWLSETYLRLGRLDEALAVAVRGLEVCRMHARQANQAWTLRLLGGSHAPRQPPTSESRLVSRCRQLLSCIVV
jgi:hypothetical protein